MADVIQDMLQQALGDVARSTKFEAYLNFNTPSLGPTNTEIYMQVKTTSFPGKTYEPYDLKFKGRSIPIRGQVKYENTWSCSFYLTEGHELKIAFEDWIESLDQTQNMSSTLSAAVQSGQSQGLNFASEISIAQMDFSGEGQTAIYTLHNVFPKSVSSVPVDYSAVGTTLEFTVEFSYSHYTAMQVGGVKLPAKTGSGATIPGFSEISGTGSQNFSMQGIGSNLMGIGSNLRDQGIDAATTIGNSVWAGIQRGDLSSVGSDVRNIASNFSGSAKSTVIGAFDEAKSNAIKMAKNQAKSAITGAVNHLASRAISQVRRADSVIPSRITSKITGKLGGEITNAASNLTKKLTDYI